MSAKTNTGTASQEVIPLQIPKHRRNAHPHTEKCASKFRFSCSVARFLQFYLKNGACLNQGKTYTDALGRAYLPPSLIVENNRNFTDILAKWFIETNRNRLDRATDRTNFTERCINRTVLACAICPRNERLEQNFVRNRPKKKKKSTYFAGHLS